MSFESLAEAAVKTSGGHHAKSGDYELKNVLTKVIDVTLSFGDKVVLKPTSVEVRDIVRPGCEQGQVIGILGPSGVGKSQFSRILSGLQAPTSGQVLISDFEKDPTGATLRPVEAGLVGMVAQDYPLFKHRTILGNLRVAQEQTKITKQEREAKAIDYLTQFGLLDKLGPRTLKERLMGYLAMLGIDFNPRPLDPKTPWTPTPKPVYPSQLSGGQRQRIAIIRQLLCAEHFIVMDEPFTGLDPIAKDTVCETINKVAQLHELNTLFVVAHDITALCQIADHLWLFGRERDEQGKPIPGATIKVQYDLIEQGLAWQPGIYDTPAFAEFVREVRAQFRTL
jgi:ABC-type polar amino acid transport system ATPase subunit